MLLQQHLNHFFYLFIHSFSFSNLFSLLNSLIFGLLWPDLGCHFWSSFQIWVVVVVVVARVSCQCQCRWVWFWWLSQLGWIASVWHGNGNCGRVSCLGPQLAGIVHFGSCLMDLFNPISGRDASHMCLISLSPRHMCTTTTPFNVGGFLVFKFLKLIIYLMENLMQHMPFVIFFFPFLSRTQLLII